MRDPTDALIEAIVRGRESGLSLPECHGLVNDVFAAWSDLPKGKRFRSPRRAVTASRSTRRRSTQQHEARP